MQGQLISGFFLGQDEYISSVKLSNAESDDFLTEDKVEYRAKKALEINSFWGVKCDYNRDKEEFWWSAKIEPAGRAGTLLLVWKMSPLFIKVQVMLNGVWVDHT